jgi:putative hydroxymethylpyrimidine transport system ATP-binding protein
MLNQPAIVAPAIALSDANLCFQHHWLFKQLALQLPAGKITCLLGPSGVGKTTLLRLLAGLPVFGRSATNQAGNYCQAHIHTSDQQPVIGRVAYMAQQDLLFPWLTARDNVLMGQRLRQQKLTPLLQQQADALLQQVGLFEQRHKKPSALSGGMRQRVALARTLMENQPIVLMDEPFSALDALTRFQMQTLAAECLSGRTVLLITHDPWEALRLGHHIVVLRGQPAQVSTPIIPATLPPRDLTDPALFSLQQQLLTELHMDGRGDV